jgi:uncharacterized membrane protein
MPATRHHSGTLAALATFVLCVPVHAQQYTVTDLGIVPGGFGAIAYGINDSGHVVGMSGRFPFLWTPETGMVALGPLPTTGATSQPAASALSIGSTGFITGWSDSPTFPKAVRWDPPNPPSDEPLNLNGTGTAWTEGRGVNSLGQVVGKYLNSAAFWAYPSGARTILSPVMPIHDFTIAYDINDAGVIVGQSAEAIDSATDKRAARWRITGEGAVTAESLDVVELRLGGAALAVNQAGDTVGWVKRPITFQGGTPFVVYRAAFWRANTSSLIEIGTISPSRESIANDINDAGVVVGESSGGFEFAWAWTQAGGFVDLGSRIPPDSGWRLRKPQGSNNRGQIVGQGVLNGQNRAFLLTPIQEPNDCPADFNGTGGLSIQDIFDFLAAYFAIDPSADFNSAGGITVQDVFDFLGAYFAGCP